MQMVLKVFNTWNVMGTDRGHWCGQAKPTHVVPTNSCGPQIFPTNTEKPLGYIIEQEKQSPVLSS